VDAMNSGYEQKKQKSYTIMRMTYDLVMAALILGMALVLLLPEKMNLEFFMSIDPVFRYLFGGICLLYGGFRLYRGIKRDY
jgi:ABC-type arginine/histidine transport system permease subunit